LLVLNITYDLEEEVEEKNHQTDLHDDLREVRCDGLVPVLAVSAAS